MSQAQANDSGLQLTLRLWHPDCWALEVTEQTAAGLLAHGLYNTQDGCVKGLFTAYADSVSDVEALIEAARDSPLTDSVLELRERHGATGTGTAPGNATRELFVEYDPDNTISDSLLSRGFIHDDPVRVCHGREHWPVFFPDSREEAERALDEIREEQSADIEVTRITSAGGGNPRQLRRTDRLSDSQREAFELARQEDYYAWPRGISTRELAAKLGVSKTTLLEHLRKAEAKLLDPDT